MVGHVFPNEIGKRYWKSHFASDQVYGNTMPVCVTVRIRERGCTVWLKYQIRANLSGSALSWIAALCLRHLEKIETLCICCGRLWIARAVTEQECNPATAGGTTHIARNWKLSAANLEQRCTVQVSSGTALWFFLVLCLFYIFLLSLLHTKWAQYRLICHILQVLSHTLLLLCFRNKLFSLEEAFTKTRCEKRP